MTEAKYREVARDYRIPVQWFSFNHDGREYDYPVVSQKADQNVPFRGALVFLCGSGQIALYQGKVREALSSLGYDVFMPEFIGYFNNEEPTEDLLRAQVAAYADEEVQGSSDVVIMGYSLGCSLALQMAAELDPPPRKLVLRGGLPPGPKGTLAPFISLCDVVGNYTGRWLSERLVDCLFDARPYLPLIHCPVYVFSGENDAIVSPRQGREIARSVPHGVFLLIHEGTYSNWPPFSELAAAAYL